VIYSPDAERQIDELRRHYRERDRPEAVRNLIAALTEAEARIERNPAAHRSVESLESARSRRAAKTSAVPIAASFSAITKRASLSLAHVVIR
jgi:plasmid stabilization system protein ParE